MCVPMCVSIFVEHELTCGEKSGAHYRCPLVSLRTCQQADVGRGKRTLVSDASRGTMGIPSPLESAVCQ